MNHSLQRRMYLLVWIAVLVLSGSQDMHGLDPSKPVTHYGHDVWDAHRGFPYFAVHSMQQSRDGYLWLATDEGLVRFDGVQFTLFDSKNTPAITHNDISSLVEDSSGNLWFGTRGGGLCKLKDGQFTAYSVHNGLAGNIIHSLCLDRNNGLWIGMESFGLSAMTGNVFASHPVVKTSEMLNIYTVYETKDGTVLLGAGGLQRKLPGATQFTSITPHNIQFVRTILETRKGLLWFGTNRGLFTLEGNQIIPCVLPGAPVSESVTCLYEDRDGVLWVGTEGNGLFRLADGKFTSFTLQHGLSSNRVLSLTEDREGNLWIGTRGGGLNRLRNQTIRTITADDGLSGDYVTAVYEDREGTVWIAIKDHGLNEVKNGGVVHRYRIGDNPSVNHVRSIEEDKNGNLFIGTMKGIFLLKKTVDGKRRMIIPVEELQQFNEYSIRSMHIRDNGDMLIGSYGSGVSQFSEGRFTQMSVGGNIRSMIESEDGSLWAAAKGSVFHITGKRTEHFSPSDGLSSDEAFSLHYENDSTIWVGTYGGGLNRIRNGKITPVTKKEGLFDNVVYAILDDGNGNYWMSSNRGIFRVRRQELNDMADGKITSIASVSYGYEDGMKSVECNGGSQPSAWKRKNGELLFATVKGCVVINPNSVRPAMNEITTMVELVIAEGDTLFPHNGQTLQLGKRRLEVHYAGITFTGAEKLIFRYRLEGIEESWVDAGNLRRAYYTTVPPGTYTFRVTAFSPDGIRNSNEASMVIVIPPYLWETVWFKIVGALVLFMTVFGIARYASTRALKQRLRELEAQQALEKERSRISQDMHDEVGASLTQIAILSELLERNITKRDAAEEYLKKISGTAHDVVGSLDEIIWFINPRHDTLDSLMLYLREYLANYFDSVGINSRFEFPEQLPSIPLAADIRRNIFLVAKEAAHNIVKHANASNVRVIVSLENEILYIRIEDDGKGLSPEQRSAFGNGLESMRKRMEDIGGTFEITSKEREGTAVVIKSKVKK